jgi:hypothetical protein
VPYRRKTMQTDRDDLPTLSRGVVLRALLVGTLMGIIVVIIDGPTWTIYLTILVVGAPYMLWQVWVTDPVRKRETAARRAAQEHGDPKAKDDSA